MSGEFSVTGMDHVTVTSPEELIDDVLAWYRSTLGLAEIDKPDGADHDGGWFAAGEQEIHISLDPHNPPKTAHFGLVVKDFDGMIQRLRDHGCHIEQASAIPGRHRCYTRDPAGNRIEITSFEEEPAKVIVEEADQG